MSVLYFSVVYHTIMLNFIDKILCQFESCFSRKASFRWFVTITIGFILRSDKLGVTSVIRDLALSPDCSPVPDPLFQGLLLISGCHPSLLVLHCEK